MSEWIGFLVWVALCAVLLRDRMSTPRFITSLMAVDGSDTGSPFRSALGTIEPYPLVRFYRSPCAKYTDRRWLSLAQHLRPLSVPSDIC
jgi:hypothetical protein